MFKSIVHFLDNAAYFAVKFRGNFMDWLLEYAIDSAKQQNYRWSSEEENGVETSSRPVQMAAIIWWLANRRGRYGIFHTPNDQLQIGKR